MIRLRRHIFRRLSRFTLIGIAATLIYAACAFLLSRNHGPFALSAPLASIVAYAVAACFSYVGHKYVTFASAGSHAFEMPRFFLLTVSGAVFSWILPLVVVDGFGASSTLAIAIVCVAVPVANYFILNRWVFAVGSKMRARS